MVCSSRCVYCHGWTRLDHPYRPHLTPAPNGVLIKVRLLPWVDPPGSPLVDPPGPPIYAISNPSPRRTHQGPAAVRQEAAAGAGFTHIPHISPPSNIRRNHPYNHFAPRFSPTPHPTTTHYIPPTSPRPTPPPGLSLTPSHRRRPSRSCAPCRTWASAPAWRCATSS